MQKSGGAQHPTMQARARVSATADRVVQRSSRVRYLKLKRSGLALLRHRYATTGASSEAEPGDRQTYGSPRIRQQRLTPGHQIEHRHGEGAMLMEGEKV